MEIKKGEVEYTCTTCKKSFAVWKFRKNVKTCSKTCHRIYQQTPEYKELLSRKHIGKVISTEQRLKISDALKGRRTGDENQNWKGDDVGYRAMHDWIRREKGLPNTCEHCSTQKRRLVWANKSHEYQRNVDDWMRLCYPCHRKYDFPNEKHRIYPK